MLIASVFSPPQAVRDLLLYLLSCQPCLSVYLSLSLYIYVCVCECDFKKQKDEGKRGEEGMLVCVWIIYGGESVDVI